MNDITKDGSEDDCETSSEGKRSRGSKRKAGSRYSNTALKLLAGNEPELLRIISILLGCGVDKDLEGNLIEARKIIIHLVEENAYSHLMEDILPPTVSSLLISLGLGKYAINFQAEEIDMVALKQMGELDLKELGIPMVKVIWEELGTKFKILSKWVSQELLLLFLLLAKGFRFMSMRFLIPSFFRRAFSKLKLEHVVIGKGKFQQERSKADGIDSMKICVISSSCVLESLGR